jgi:hypothetical protein
MSRTKPDLLVIQPIHFDAPGFRQQVRKYRDYFSKIIFVWSQHHVEGDIVSWVENLMKDDQIDFVSWQVVQQHPSPDWGHRAVHSGLMRVTGSHVLVTQQDFLVHNDRFYDIVFSSGYSLVSHHGYKEHGCGDGVTRFEPDFIYIEMDKMRQTSMDCSAEPPVQDHWGRLSEELRRVCPDYKTLEDLGLHSPADWEHLQGLFVGYRFLQLGMIDSIHNIERFSEYNKSILNLLAYPENIPWIQKAAALR